MLFESTLMGSALRGMLAIDERIIFFAILVGMGEGNLDIIALQMDDGIEGIAGHTVFQQILQTMTRENATTIIHDDQSRIQIGIVAQHVFHNLIVELIVVEHRCVGLEIDIGAVLILCRFCDIAGQFATLESRLAHLTITITMHLEMRTQRIHSLHTHTIQSDRLLESLRIKLSAGVQDTDGIDELTLRDASTIVAHRNAMIILNVHLNTVACLHLELVDRVVEHLFQQHIDAVFW